VVIGFGVSRPEHVRAAVSSGADGAISGSAVVSIISENLGDVGGMMSKLSAFTKTMSDATGMRE
jgi:tryptophan synthase alpha chain